MDSCKYRVGVSVSVGVGLGVLGSICFGLGSPLFFFFCWICDCDWLFVLFKFVHFIISVVVEVERTK